MALGHLAISILLLKTTYSNKSVTFTQIIFNETTNTEPLGWAT